MKLLVEARNAAVAVENGIIVPIRGRHDVVVRIADGELRPGLINAHDHLHRNHYGRLGNPPYDNAYAWGRDIHRREAARIAAGRALPRRDALLRGAWKNLVAGVTTVVHHDAWESAFDAGFPIRVERIASAHSLGLEPSFAFEPPESPFAIHLAEGVDAESAEEVRAMERRGLLTPGLLAVHVCGVDADGIARLRRAGVAIVWCPTSNDFLFGCCVPTALLAPGIDVLIGSDSLLTGAGSLLDELRFARGLAMLDDDRLVDAVGAVAARRLGMAPPSLECGARADLVVLRRPLLEADEHDVALVVCSGEVRVLDPALAPMLGRRQSAGRIVTTGALTRWVSDQDRSLRGGSGDAPNTNLPASTRVMR